MPATFVLVPGAWLGAWVWDRVATALSGRGHRVVPLSLTGLGERASEATPDTDLDTHIADVVGVLEADDLSDAVLVGHSYAGAVVAGAADRAGQRLAGVVYVDTAPLPDGTRMLDLYPPEAAEALRAAVTDGFRLPFPGWEALAADTSTAGLGRRERALVEARATAQPFGTYTRPLRLTGAGDDVPRAAVACDDVRGLVAAGPLADLAGPPWRYRELSTGHWPMLSAPAALADVLEELAAGDGVRSADTRNIAGDR